jgi:hypothetical protein
MQISFCSQWSRHGNRPRHVFSPDHARAAHAHNKLYTVLIGDPSHPSCFLEFSRFRSVCVEFLDAALRTYFDYSFQELRPGELFISMSRRLQFPNNTDPPNRATVLYFKPEGQLVVCGYVSNPDGIGSKLVDRKELTVDVSRNWEPYPKFGNYEGLVRLDRGSPWLRPDGPT